jgi:hypothetical protein
MPQRTNWMEVTAAILWLLAVSSLTGPMPESVLIAVPLAFVGVLFWAGSERRKAAEREAMRKSYRDAGKPVPPWL